MFSQPFFTLHRTVLMSLLIVTFLIAMGIATFTNSPAFATSSNPLYAAEGITFVPDEHNVLILPETIGTM